MSKTISFLELESPINIVDVGASYLDKPIYDALIQLEFGVLYGFEPDAEQCAKLSAHYSPPHRFFPHFIADGDLDTFYETNWFATGSLYRPNEEFLSKLNGLENVMQLVTEHEIAPRRLDDCEDLPPADFLKIDVQGAELSAIRSGADRVLADLMVAHIEVEFEPIYIGQPLFADVDLYMRERGFRFLCFRALLGSSFKPLRYSNQRVTQQLWSDAVYIRDFKDFSSIPIDSWKKMALIAHYCYQFYDLSMCIAEEIDKSNGSDYAQRYAQLLNSAQKQVSADPGNNREG